MIEEAVGYSKVYANTKCEEVGGFVISPMNEMYNKDLEDLLANSTGLNGTDFWIGVEKSFNPLRMEFIFQFINKVYIFDQHFSNWATSHFDPDGECVKGKLDENGKFVWVRYPCTDESGGGVICAKRNIWELVPNCYVQPPEEIYSGIYQEIPETALKQDPVKFCREACEADSRYFDINTNDTATFCHCIENPVPLGGFLSKEDCSVPTCGTGQTPANDSCQDGDGFRRTTLYRTWKTSCPPIEADLTEKFIYVWDHHGSWHWGSKATLRCLPGYELPLNIPNGEFDVDFRSQNVSCKFDENDGGRWSYIVACEPVRCKTLPPPQPDNGTITVVKSLDPLTNDQAETILTYTCNIQNWAFSYPYDESQPSFAFTENVDNITIACNYSGYWEYNAGIDGETCINQQPDGTCERIVIPECHDRSIYCKPLVTPGNASKELIVQPNPDNELEYLTKIQFTCPQTGHYFDYAVPPDLVSFYYSTNIKTTTLTCNEYKYWTVENGINGETCADKNLDDDELWCEDVIIPECVDRAILCTTPPTPARADIVFNSRPDPLRFEYETEIQYTCPDRNHYFDYPVPEDFISFHYTDNINTIDISCTKEGNWEVTGGLDGLTCEDQIEVNSTDNSTTVFRCDTVTIPDCEDRTVYCTFPPENIYGGDITTANNPSPFYKKTDTCRWTKWFNTEMGGKGDDELLVEHLGLFSWQVCPKPKDIQARIVSTKEIVSKTGGPQVYSSYDTEFGFICKNQDQSNGDCFDYEIQLCCPYAPEPNTQVSLSCNEDNWYLDFQDAPFIPDMSATCTKNSTWISDVDSKTFCKDGSLECVLAEMPDCQDRTIVCLDELVIPKGIVQANVSSNDTLHGFSLTAAYEYSCEEEGFVIDIPYHYPEALVVSCTEPEGYPNEWYYEIWRDGIWKDRGNITRCIDPNRCYTPPPTLPLDYSVEYNFTLDSSDFVNTTLQYNCNKNRWVFDIPPLFHQCNLEPEECEAIGAVKLHEFNHSVYAPNTIFATCETGERPDGLPDWTWFAEGYKFHRPMPKCFDPTYCYDDPPVPQRTNAFYDIPQKGTLKYLDGEAVRYTCANSVYRFPMYDGTPKDDWKDTQVRFFCVVNDHRASIASK